MMSRKLLVILVILSLLMLSLTVDVSAKKPFAAKIKHDSKLPPNITYFTVQDAGGPLLLSWMSDKNNTNNISAWQIFRGWNSHNLSLYTTILFPGQIEEGAYIYLDYNVERGSWRYEIDHYTFDVIIYYYAVRSVNKFGIGDMSINYGFLGANSPPPIIYP